MHGTQIYQGSSLDLFWSFFEQLNKPFTFSYLIFVYVPIFFVYFFTGLQVKLQESVYGTQRDYLGSVQAKLYSFYGPICNKSWDDKDANATCHGLNYTHGLSFYGRDNSGGNKFDYIKKFLVLIKLPPQYS